jgi:hypothetical protein
MNVVGSCLFLCKLFLHFIKVFGYRRMVIVHISWVYFSERAYVVSLERGSLCEDSFSSV